MRSSGEPGTPPRAAGVQEPDDGLSDLQYFHAVENVFILHRGAPLQLSPSDYHVIRTWHRDGVPLDLVVRTIEEFFERHDRREAPRKIWSLRQCRRSVDAAWKTLRELTAPGERTPEAEAAPLELAPRLEALAASLPEELPGRDDLAGRIAALAALGEPRAVEERLVALEEEAVAGLLAELRPRERKALEAQVDRALAAVAGRIPADEAERTRERLLRQRVRRKAGLQPLSLFGS